MLKITIPVLLAALASTGCQPSSAPSAPIDQARICETTAWEPDSVASICKSGQKVVFLPSSWGNEQLPVLFAAVNCDLRYSVAMTKGAVTCIYMPIARASENSKAPMPRHAD